MSDVFAERRELRLTPYARLLSTGLARSNSCPCIPFMADEVDGCGLAGRDPPTSNNTFMPFLTSHTVTERAGEAGQEPVAPCSVRKVKAPEYGIVTSVP